MLRSLFVMIAATALAVPATAQTSPIQWGSNIKQAAAQAKSNQLPLMIYVAGSSGKDDDDMKQAQQRSFRDQLVTALAQERFITVRLAKSTQSAAFLNEIGAPSEHGYYLLFTTPDLKIIGTIQPGQVAQAQTLATQMTVMFRKYRQELFEREMRPKLEIKDTKEAEIIAIFKKINKLLLLEADQAVIKLLEERELAANVKKQAYNTLATLSTPACVKALLKVAPGDKLAEQALGRCTAGAAEELIPSLDAENFDEFVIAYEALVKICKLGKKKTRGFWNGQNERLINDELDRVEKGAQAAAKRWKDKYAAYR